VTPFANGEIVAAKRSLAVVTGHAALRPATGVMVERFGRRHLSSLRHACSYLMAFSAADLLMFRVIKADAKSRRGCRGARITAQLMTCSARRDIATRRLRARRVAPVTSCVRIKS
jgi:hypothetical protein